MRIFPPSHQGRQKALLAIFIVLAAVALLQWPQACAGGVRRGLTLCGTVLIPSLFPFLVLSGLFVRTGIANAIGRRWERLTHLLFGLPGCCAAGILLAFLGGYPTGAAIVAQLRRQRLITAEEGVRMMRFCVAGGPGFVISAVGVGMTGYIEWGYLLFVAQIFSALFLGVWGVPKSARSATVSAPASSSRGQSFPVSLVEAVSSAVETLLSSCGFVLLFSALLSLIDAAGLSSVVQGKLFSTMLSCFLEVSGGCLAASSAGVAAPFLLGFAVCFGGLSVHCQIAAILRGTGVMTPAFFVSRLTHGVLGGTLALLLFQLFPLSLPVFGSSASPVIHLSYGSSVISAALLLLCGIWMLTFGNRKSDTVLDFSQKL